MDAVHGRVTGSMARHVPRSAVVTGILLAFILTSGVHVHVLLHAVLDAVGVAIAASVFLFVWSTRRFFEHGFFRWMGTALLFAGLFDLLHGLSWQGVTVLTLTGPFDTEQLSIMARLFYLVGFAAAVGYAGRRVPLRLPFSLSCTAALLFLGLLAGDLLPACYRYDSGFTAFRTGVTAGLLALAVVVFLALIRRRRFFDQTVFRNLMVAISSAAAAELLFLLQRQPFDPLAAAGIFLRIPAYLALYNAILVTGMVRPYDMLFHRLARHAQKLRQEKDLAQLYFDTAAVMMVVMDAGERIVSVNRRSCDVLGYTAGDMIGKNWFDLIVPASFREEARSRYRRYLTRSPDRLTSFESPIMTRTGEERLIAWHSRLLKDVGSVENLMVLRSGEDVTERRRMERDLERLVEEKTHELETTLKELQDARRLSDIGTLAASVAHELRNPLGVIRTAAYNMRRKGVGPALHRNLDNIEKKVLEGSHIINNLLNYARLKLPQYEPVNILDVLAESLETVNSRFLTHMVEVEVNAGDMIAGLRIDADPHQLGEVLTNVLTNAFQALPDRTGRVGVTVTAGDEWLEILITDTGTGIPAGALPRIYEPFFTTKSKGTGLGLTICSEVLHLHGGTLEIESTEGEGTMVRVRLPIKRRQGNGRGHSADR